MSDTWSITKVLASGDFTTSDDRSRVYGAVWEALESTNLDCPTVIRFISDFVVSVEFGFTGVAGTKACRRVAIALGCKEEGTTGPERGAPKFVTSSGGLRRPFQPWDSKFDDQPFWVREAYYSSL